MHTLDVGAYLTRINATLIDPNFIHIVNADQNIGTRLRLRCACIWAINFDTGFFNERCRYDKENKHNKNHVEHWRDIDLAFFCCGGQV